MLYIPSLTLLCLVLHRPHGRSRNLPTLLAPGDLVRPHHSSDVAFVVSSLGSDRGTKLIPHVCGARQSQYPELRESR